MPRSFRLRESRNGLDVADTNFARSENEVQYPQPRFVGEGFEDFG
jgi:hypothetical protein